MTCWHRVCLAYGRCQKRCSFLWLWQGSEVVTKLIFFLTEVFQSATPKKGKLGSFEATVAFRPKSKIERYASWNHFIYWGSHAETHTDLKITTQGLCWPSDSTERTVSLLKTVMRHEHQVEKRQMSSCSLLTWIRILLLGYRKSVRKKNHRSMNFLRLFSQRQHWVKSQ